MAKIGEIRHASKIGYKGRASYIWHACIDCGRERWVKLVRGIPLFQLCNTCSGRRAGRAQAGSLNPNWRGGRKKDKDGYILVKLSPDDFFYPMANNKGYVLEHRLIMAKHLGRNLHPWEVVYHKNEIQDNNLLSNLELTMKSYHSSKHNRQRHLAIIGGKIK